MPTESLIEAPVTNCSTPVLGSIPLTTNPAIEGRKSAVHRKISPSDGRALEMLGHSIEYLADEYVLSGRQLVGLETTDPRIHAIQILMAANRAVYYACPEVEPLHRRLARRIFGSRILDPSVRDGQIDAQIDAGIRTSMEAPTHVSR